jgi:hypothetical protein
VIVGGAEGDTSACAGEIEKKRVEMRRDAAIEAELIRNSGCLIAEY